MKYQQPEIVHVGTALALVQSTDKADPRVPDQQAIFALTANAYEADE